MTFRLLPLLLAFALAMPLPAAAAGSEAAQQTADGEWAAVEKRLQDNLEAMAQAVKAKPTPLEGWWRKKGADASGLPLVQFQGQAFRYLIHEDFALGGTFSLNGSLIDMRGELLDEGGIDCDEGPWHETMTFAVKNGTLTLSSEKDGDTVFERLDGDPFQGQEAEGARSKRR